MTFIDWSDPEEMFGLLSEYVADERGDSQHDPARVRFLIELSATLDSLARRFNALSQTETIERLRAIRDSQPSEFARDLVLDHLDACIEELERISDKA